MIRRTFPVVMMLLVLASVVAAPAMAQTIGPDAILLDQDFEEVGSVTVDGDTYTVYQIENRLPYAGGVEVYANGERVTSQAEAAMAIRALTQSQAVETIDEDDLRLLQAIEANMSAMTALTGPMTEVLDETVALLEDVRVESGDANDTAWAAINDSVTYEAFNESQAELGTTIDDWVVASAHLESNTTALSSLLDQHLAGDAVDVDELYDQYVTTMDALETFDDRTGDLQSGLASVAATSGEMAVASYGLPDFETALTVQFAKLGAQAQLTAETLVERTDPVLSDGDELADLQSMAESSERNLVNDWDGRIGAASSVYQTIIVVGVGLAGIAGIALWKFGRDRSE